MTNIHSPVVSADGQTLYFTDDSFSVWYAATRFQGFGSFTNQHTVGSALGQGIMPPDELTMFSWNTASGRGQEVVVSTRSDKTAMFGNKIAVDSVNSTASEIPVALSDDGCVLYISSDRPSGVGGFDIWEAHRPRL